MMSVTLVDFGLDGFLSTTEATMSSSVAQLRVRGTEEQRERRRESDESGNARSEQLLMMPTEQVTDREWLPGEHLILLRRQLLEGKILVTEQLKGD